MPSAREYAKRDTNTMARLSCFHISRPHLLFALVVFSFFVRPSRSGAMTENFTFLHSNQLQKCSEAIRSFLSSLRQINKIISHVKETKILLRYIYFLWLTLYFVMLHTHTVKQTEKINLLFSQLFSASTFTNFQHNFLLFFRRGNFKAGFF